MSVRVRFAPSPTGALHVGGARTALFNFLFAKNQGGRLILRIEDTDQERHQEKSLLPLLQSLEWLGLSWDEGPFLEPKHREISEKGAFGPYRQKSRLGIYRQLAQKLLAEGKAYHCFLTEEEEAAQKAQAIAEGKAYIPSSPYRDLSLKEAEKKLAAGKKACVRFKHSLQKAGDLSHLIIQDMVRGEVRFPLDTAGDFILIRSDGFPVYNFSCAADDALMKISHVFRGEEHLSNTLKQRLIQEALGLPSPKTGHLSIVLGKDKKKLSKRTGSQSLEHFRTEGFLPEAMANFLALLGWSPGGEREQFSMEDLIRLFSPERLNPAAAVFDENKLLWLNEQHIKERAEEELWRRLKPFLKKADLAANQFWKDKPWGETRKILETLRSGFKTLKQAAELLRPFSDQGFSLQESAYPALKWPASRRTLESWRRHLQERPKDFLSQEDFQAIQKSVQKEEGVRGKEFFMPLRCALLGAPQGAEIKLLAALLKREELIRRAEIALAACGPP